MLIYDLLLFVIDSILFYSTMYEGLFFLIPRPFPSFEVVTVINTKTYYTVLSNLNTVLHNRFGKNQFVNFFANCPNIINEYHTVRD